MHDARPSEGRFVTFEGPDGSGKSVQSERLARRLAAAGIPVTVTRQPGGTLLGERIREIVLHTRGLHLVPAADAMLFNAARAQLVAEVIRPALSRGDVVVCDRHADSMLAYQGYGGGVPLDALEALVELAVGGLRPDLTILIDLPVEEGLRRKSGGEEMTRFEAEKQVDFHERVRRGFHILAAGDPDRFVTVDGCQAPETIEEAVVEALLPRLAERDREALLAAVRSEPDGRPARKGL